MTIHFSTYALSPVAIDRIAAERREHARMVSQFHEVKKLLSAHKDFSGARMMSDLAKESERWVKAATWVLGWLGEGEWVPARQWSRDLQAHISGIRILAEIAHDTAKPEAA